MRKQIMTNASNVCKTKFLAQKESSRNQKIFRNSILNFSLFCIFQYNFTVLKTLFLNGGKKVGTLLVSLLYLLFLSLRYNGQYKISIAYGYL